MYASGVSFGEVSCMYSNKPVYKLVNSINPILSKPHLSISLYK
jgi:hypothetical protein